jgi:hypothetical protein
MVPVAPMTRMRMRESYPDGEGIRHIGLALLTSPQTILER